jgi:hypothetical protein
LEIIYTILGFSLGLIARGVKINIYHKDKSEQDKPVEYNKAPVEHIPPEMRDYAEKNRGYINF